MTRATQVEAIDLTNHLSRLLGVELEHDHRSELGGATTNMRVSLSGLNGRALEGAMVPISGANARRVALGEHIRRLKFAIAILENVGREET